MRNSVVQALFSFILKKAKSVLLRSDLCPSYRPLLPAESPQRGRVVSAFGQLGARSCSGFIVLSQQTHRVLCQVRHAGQESPLTLVGSDSSINRTPSFGAGFGLLLF